LCTSILAIRYGGLSSWERRACLVTSIRVAGYRRARTRRRSIFRSITHAPGQQLLGFDWSMANLDLAAPQRRHSAEATIVHVLSGRQASCNELRKWSSAASRFFFEGTADPHDAIRVLIGHDGELPWMGVKADEEIDCCYRAVAVTRSGIRDTIRVSAERLTKCRSNFEATTPKHHRQQGIIRDQKTKLGTTNHNPVRSAKPPSPVQIRAASNIYM
jgi:hypothetical protein